MPCDAHDLNAMETIASKSTTQDPLFVKHSNELLKDHIITIVVSLLFQLAGFVTPGWYRYSQKSYGDFYEYSTQRGLWYTYECVNEECGFYTLEHIGLDVAAAFWPYRIEKSIALLSCITVLIITIRMAWKQAITIGTNITVAFISLLSGILSLASFGDLPNSETDNGRSVGFPYSVGLTGFGGALSCIVCPLSLLLVRYLHQQQKQQTHDRLQMTGIVSHGQMMPNAVHLAPATYQTSISPTHQPSQYSAAKKATHQTRHERSASLSVEQRSEEGAVLLQTTGTSPDYQNELREVGTNYLEQDPDYSRKLQKPDVKSDNINESEL